MIERMLCVWDSGGSPVVEIDMMQFYKFHKRVRTNRFKTLYNVIYCTEKNIDC